MDRGRREEGGACGADGRGEARPRPRCRADRRSSGAEGRGSARVRAGSQSSEAVGGATRRTDQPGGARPPRAPLTDSAREAPARLLLWRGPPSTLAAFLRETSVVSVGKPRSAPCSRLCIGWPSWRSPGAPLRRMAGRDLFPTCRGYFPQPVARVREQAVSSLAQLRRGPRGTPGYVVLGEGLRRRRVVGAHAHAQSGRCPWASGCLGGLGRAVGEAEEVVGAAGWSDQRHSKNVNYGCAFGFSR